ncbi:Uncharacterised protein [Collinsella aerofaciens]|uniref:Uncharacterized protein n=1 Tax=Collinsella aerofaciens TaxID=74426 RepID=A0A174JZW0_9ACTN|nr:Uncharacterised protein [Collinsella aerofaciens]
MMRPVEQEAGRRLSLDNLVACGARSQWEVVRACFSSFIRRDGSDSLTVECGNATVGAHDITRGTDLKDGAREAAAVYGIGFNDPDISGRGVVIIRGDCNGR